YHRTVPVRDLTLPDREGLSQCRMVRAEGRLEEEHGIIPLAGNPVHGDQDSARDRQPGEPVLVQHDLGPCTTLLTPVKEPVFRDPVLAGKGFPKMQELPESPEELGMGPAPVIDQLPERPFSDRLPDMTDLG